MATSWGVNDPDDVQHHEPIFTWELAEGLRVVGAPSTPWEMAGAAMATLSTLGARRGGGAAALLLDEVTASAPDTVEVAPRARPKEQRERASRRPRRQRKPVVLRHWMIRAHVQPWLEWHRRHRSPSNALLFPSITAQKSPAPTALGFAADGQWVEPLRPWSARQKHALLARYIQNLGSRSFHGFRAGNQRELRRWETRGSGEEHVSAVTRRVLHGRSLRHLIGSEAAYDEVFAEDLAHAVQILGRLRIERTKNGLLAVTATSASAGENPSDWVSMPGGPMTLPEREAEGSASGSSSDTASSADVVGDGGVDTRVMRCGRCKTRLSARDYGFLCDYEGCKWGTCTSCHPGGARARLLCPVHESEQGAASRR